MLLEGIADVYTLRNYGKSVNCSLASLYPARVTVLSLSVGMTNTKRDMELETGTIHKVSILNPLCVAWQYNQNGYPH